MNFCRLSMVHKLQWQTLLFWSSTITCPSLVYLLLFGIMNCITNNHFKIILPEYFKRRVLFYLLVIQQPTDYRYPLWKSHIRAEIVRLKILSAITVKYTVACIAILTHYITQFCNVIGEMRKKYKQYNALENTRFVYKNPFWKYR